VPLPEYLKLPAKSRASWLVIGPAIERMIAPHLCKVRSNKRRTSPHDLKHR
jgi:hypothetical protein